MSATVPGVFTQGKFSPAAGTTQDQAWLDAAMAGRYASDPVIREYYYCNLIQQCDFGTWLTENMGYAETCFKDYNIVREYGTESILHLKNAGAVVIPVTPGTAVLPIANASHFVAGAYVYPQVGDGLLLPPDGTIGVITAVTPGTNSTTITVKLLNSASTVTIPINADLIVLPGKFLADCECPSGKFRVEDVPIEQNIVMKTLGTSSGQICGDALLACQNVRYEYAYMDANGCRQTTEKWYGGALQKMYQEHEHSKLYSYLFDPSFGIITTLRAKSIRWNWADPTAITLADIADLKEAIQAAGLGCMEYSIFLGPDAFRSFQTLANDQATGRVSYAAFNPADCKWINLHFCTISDSGMTIHAYEECAFGNGKMLGAVGFDYDNRGIGVPMCMKPAKCKRKAETDNKMFTIVNFRDNRGVIWDNVTDSNGILNGPGGRNTFGTGCKFHEFSIESTYAVEVACPEAWILVNFPA